MKWQGRRGSSNIEDRRRRPTRRRGAAPKLGGMGLIIVLVAGYFLGIDVSPLLNNQAAGGIATNGSSEITAADERICARNRIRKHQMPCQSGLSSRLIAFLGSGPARCSKSSARWNAAILQRR